MKEFNQEDKEYLTITELAEILGISRVAVFKKIKKGDVKAQRIGNMYIIPSSYVAEVFGKTLSSRRKKAIEEAVYKAVQDYGEVLVRLGSE